MVASVTKFSRGPVAACTLRAEMALRCFDAHKRVHWLESTARCTLMGNGSASPLAIGGVNAGTRISFGADFPPDITEHRSDCSPGYKSRSCSTAFQAHPASFEPWNKYSDDAVPSKASSVPCRHCAAFHQNPHYHILADFRYHDFNWYVVPLDAPMTGRQVQAISLGLVISATLLSTLGRYFID